MKKIYILLSNLLLTLALTGQVPESFNYQAILRDASGSVKANINVAIDIAILKGGITGTQVFIETHSVKTNEFGLVTLKIGSKNTSGFSDIDWKSDEYFIKIFVDGTEMGVSQILSVPYALYAKEAGNGFSGDYNDLINTPAIFSGSYNDLIDTPTLFTGHFGDLLDLPTTLGGYGITNAMSNSHPAYSITNTNISNWNTAYGWGNHSGLYRPISYVPTWNEIINKPTSVVGYGITDAVTTFGNQTISGTKSFTGAINMNNKTISNVANPINNGDATNKAYVDQLLVRIEALEAIVGYTTFIDTRDNHQYNEILIGNQVWLAENLAYLPSVSSPSSQSSTVSLYYVYGYNGANVSEAKATANYQDYGVLYNWHAAMDGATSSNNNPSGIQGVCPTGWHLPSDSEWKELEIFLGMTQNEADNAYWRGSNEGGKLKETGYIHWLAPNSGATNSSGFTALPGGILNSSAAFGAIGEFATFWTSTHDVNNLSNSIGRHLAYNEQRVYYNAFGKYLGLSVRCVKD